MHLSWCNERRSHVNEHGLRVVQEGMEDDTFPSLLLCPVPPLLLERLGRVVRCRNDNPVPLLRESVGPCKHGYRRLQERRGDFGMPSKTAPNSSIDPHQRRLNGLEFTSSAVVSLKFGSYCVANNVLQDETHLPDWWEANKGRTSGYHRKHEFRARCLRVKCGNVDVGPDRVGVFQ